MIYFLLVFMGLYITALTIYAFGWKTLTGRWQNRPLYFVELHDWTRPSYAKLYKLHLRFYRWPTVEGLQTALDDYEAHVDTWSLPKSDVKALIAHFREMLKYIDRKELAKQHSKTAGGWYCDQVGGAMAYKGDTTLGGIRIDEEKVWQ
jgi:hypothetical protein